MQKKNVFTDCNTDSAIIKIVALMFMIIDHVGAKIFPNISDLRILGRISFPLFAWGIVLGACYTRNIWLYLLRVLIIGFISQPIYNIVLNHSWQHLNVLFTISLALLGIAGMQEKNIFTKILLPIIAIAISKLLSVDYGSRGVLFIMLLYLAKDSKASLSAFYIAFTMYWGASSYVVRKAFGIDIDYSNPIVQLLSPWLKMQGFSILALPFMLINTNSGIKINKWISYTLYPAHLLIIALIQYILALY